MIMNEGCCLVVNPLKEVGIRRDDMSKARRAVEVRIHHRSADCMST
jgi:hypothetical protein